MNDILPCRPYLDKIFESLDEKNSQYLNRQDQWYFQNEQTILNIFHETCEHLPESLKLRIHCELFGWGPLTNLLDVDGITEIIVNSKDSIWIESSGTLKQHEDHFYSEITLKNFFERFFKNSNIVVNRNKPFGSGNWRGFRVQVTGNPITDGFTLCLRKLNSKTLSRDELVAGGWCAKKEWKVIERWIQEKKNFIIAGPTGAGKTTILNALLAHIPLNERVAIIEDTNEILSPNECSTKMLTKMDLLSEGPEVNQTDLLKLSLRMRPDRIVVGEVRGGEAKDLVLALSTGHRGSLSTIHADSGQQVLARLEMLVQMGAPQWQTDTIRKMIGMGIDGIIVVNKINGRRSLIEISELSAVEPTGITLNVIYKKVAATDPIKLERLNNFQAL